jgi:hypothetical protein
MALSRYLPGGISEDYLIADRSTFSVVKVSAHDGSK